MFVGSLYTTLGGGVGCSTRIICRELGVDWRRVQQCAGQHAKRPAATNASTIILMQCTKEFIE